MPSCEPRRLCLPRKVELDIPGTTSLLDAEAISTASACLDLSSFWRPMSDNIVLSEPRAVRAEPSVPATADALVAHYLDAARAPNTRRAYDFDLKDFGDWGGAVPASADDVARYLAERAAVLRPSTLRRRLAALASVHRDKSFPDPTKTTLVRRVLQGIERKHGTSVRQAEPLLIGDLARIIAVMSGSPRECRDKALLLTGFFGALRRSELVTLRVSQVEARPDSLALCIARSKVDQTGQGRVIVLRARADALCPVRAVTSWLSLGLAGSGALFPRMVSSSVSGSDHLSPESLSRMVKHYTARIGLDPNRYSGHSLRSGFVTSAALSGIDATLIARQTGHRSQQVLAGYVRSTACPEIDHS